MNLLLDTNAWLWFVLDDRRLSGVARTHIQSPEDVKFVSPASYWEIAIKTSLGKLQLSASYTEFVQAAIEGNGFQVLDISPRHTDRVSNLPFPRNGHRDPFDRLLACQALVEGMALLSSDGELD